MTKAEQLRSRVLAVAAGLLLALGLAACAGPAQQADSPGGQDAQQLASALAEDDGTAEDLGVLTINVSLNDNSFQPAAIFIPVGRPVQLVVRNHGSREHHFHIMGLPTKELLWLVQDHENPDAAVADEEHMEHLHDPAGAFVPYHICTSESGICPTGEWVHAHANPGETDVILFTTATKGTFDIVCPLHPEIQGTATVF